MSCFVCREILWNMRLNICHNVNSKCFWVCFVLWNRRLRNEFRFKLKLYIPFHCWLCRMRSWIFWVAHSIVLRFERNRILSFHFGNQNIFYFSFLNLKIFMHKSIFGNVFFLLKQQFDLEGKKVVFFVIFWLVLHFCILHFLIISSIFRDPFCTCFYVLTYINIENKI